MNWLTTLNYGPWRPVIGELFRTPGWGRQINLVDCRVMTPPQCMAPGAFMRTMVKMNSYRVYNKLRKASLGPIYKGECK